MEWEWEWSGRDIRRSRQVIPQSEFLAKRFQRPTLAALRRKGSLISVLNPPFRLIGEADFGGIFTGYGLDPGTIYLWPNFELETDPQLVSRNILAINTNIKVEGTFIERHGDALPAAIQVSPQKRRREDDSSGGESIRSTDSDDADLPGGFLFVQIGSLIAYTGDWAKTQALGRGDIVAGSWTATEYGVVLQIDSRGRPGSVWVIYNFHNEDEEGRCPRAALMFSPTLGGSLGNVTRHSPLPRLLRTWRSCRRARSSTLKFTLQSSVRLSVSRNAKARREIRSSASSSRLRNWIATVCFRFGSCIWQLGLVVR